MRRWVLIIRVAGAAGLVAVFAGVPSPVSSQQPPQRTTLQLFEGYEGSFLKDVDVTPRGEWGRPGDYSVAIQPLYDPASCEKVGRNIGRFTIVRKLSKDNSWYIFDATTNLSGGKITLYGSAKFSDFFAEGGATAAVTGGTGNYTDARGGVAIGPAEMCGERGSMYTFSFPSQP